MIDDRIMLYDVDFTHDVFGDMIPYLGRSNTKIYDLLIYST